MLDADSILPGESFIQLARTIEGNDNTAIIQARFVEISSETIFGRVSNFRFFIDNFLYTYYYYYMNPGFGFYMGHNAIIRVEAFMKCCNLPVSTSTRYFPSGKMTSHDYYEGCLMNGGGYETWVLPQIIAFDQQLHNILTFYLRERRWLVGAQEWFRFFMSKSLNAFGRITIFQRAIFYYAALLGLCGTFLFYYGFHYAFTHPLRSYGVVSYVSSLKDNSYTVGTLLIIASLITLPLVGQIFVYFLVLKKKHLIKTMGGSVKFLFSYYVFVIVNGMTQIIAMCILSQFLILWLARKRITWAAQDRDGTLLPWLVCYKAFWYISFIGAGLLAYAWEKILPYVNKLTVFCVTGLTMDPWQIDLFEIFLLFPALVMLFAPVFARVTSRKAPIFQKLQWLKTYYDDDNLYPVVRKTYQYTEELKNTLEKTASFDAAIADPWFALRHMVSIPYKPKKYAFWKEKLQHKNIKELTRLEKLVVLRCRELWEMFFLKEYARKKNKIIKTTK